MEVGQVPNWGCSTKEKKSYCQETFLQNVNFMRNKYVYILDRIFIFTYLSQEKGPEVGSYEEGNEFTGSAGSVLQGERLLTSSWS
jgi:hypothetical protein